MKSEPCETFDHFGVCCKGSYMQVKFFFSHGIPGIVLFCVTVVKEVVWVVFDSSGIFPLTRN